jgi:hypothetical protein
MTASGASLQAFGVMPMWRRAVRTDPEGEETLDKAQAAFANLVVFLAEWRNAYGGGHGRSEYPPGLKPRHARLATDAAETCARFIVTTMDDLQLQPQPTALRSGPQVESMG